MKSKAISKSPLEITSNLQPSIKRIDLTRLTFILQELD